MTATIAIRMPRALRLVILSLKSRLAIIAEAIRLAPWSVGYICVAGISLAAKTFVKEFTYSPVDIKRNAQICLLLKKTLEGAFPALLHIRRKASMGISIMT